MQLDWIELPGDQAQNLSVSPDSSNGWQQQLQQRLTPWLTGKAAFYLGGRGEVATCLKRWLKANGVKGTNIRYKPFWLPGKQGY